MLYSSIIQWFLSFFSQAGISHSHFFHWIQENHRLQLEAVKVNEESVILKTFKSPVVSTFLQPDVDSVKFYHIYKLFSGANLTKWPQSWKKHTFYKRYTIFWQLITFSWKCSFSKSWRWYNNINNTVRHGSICRYLCCVDLSVFSLCVISIKPFSFIVFRNRISSTSFNRHSTVSFIVFE